MKQASPGSVLKNEIDERGWDAAELARRSGLELELIEKILENERAITRVFAKALGKALGTSADLWYQLSSNWRQWLRETPVEAGGWLTVEVRKALEAIQNPNVAKKRATVILLAFAEANQVPKTEVFRDPRACNQRIWYQKWQDEPEIASALEVCTQQALAWRDQETARIEATATQERRRAIAEGSLDAVKGLRVTALRTGDRADYRTEASRTLLTLADEELAARLAKIGSRAMPVEITEQPETVVKLDVSELPTDVLRAIADESPEGGTAQSSAESVSE